MSVASPVYVPLEEWLSVDEWPIVGIVPDDALDDLFVRPPFRDASDSIIVPFLLLAELPLKVPGIDSVSLVMGSPGATELTLSVKTSPFVATFSVPLKLRIDAEILRPLKDGT